MSSVQETAFSRSHKLSYTGKAPDHNLQNEFQGATGSSDDVAVPDQIGDYHPVLLWMEHLEISDAQMPQILGIGDNEYRQLRNDPYDGPLHKLSPDLIINFCRHIRVHPAHLCSLQEDFRNTIHPSVLAANMMVADDMAYSPEDRRLASHAIDVEYQRYSLSFLSNPEYGRIGEKLNETLERLYDSFLDGDLHRGEKIWVWDDAAKLACEESLATYQRRHAETRAEIIALNEGVTSSYVDILSKMQKTLSGKVMKFFPAVLVKRCLDETEGMQSPAQEDIEWVLRDSVRELILEGENRFHSFCKKEGIRYRKEFALDEEIKSLAKMIGPYVAFCNETNEKVSKLEEKLVEIIDEEGVLEIWERMMSEKTNPATQIVSRLFANHLLIAEYDEQKIRALEPRSQNQTNEALWRAANPT